MKIDKCSFEHIKKSIFKIMNFNFNGEIITKPVDGVYVKCDSCKAVVSDKSRTLLARSLMLLAKNIKEGKENFEILQKPRFENCGAMIDCSRNGVLTVEAAKIYLNYMMILGLNTMWLYMEDTYQLSGYPYFGYMRGAYSKNELKEIDDYAFSLGIEVIPYIQTLGHMSQFLRWPESQSFKDSSSVLLCDNEETYLLIDKMIKTMSECFRTKRINIGMDETFEMGKGKYLNFHQPTSQYYIFMKHLNRVIDICEKYSLKPMIEGDMIYALATNSRHLYDIKGDFPKDKLRDIPKCQIVSWGYDLEKEDDFYKMISTYQKMGNYTGKKTIYLGGIHIWGRILPDYDYCFDRMEGAIRACLKLNITDVIASCWGDDGTETNIGYSIPMLALYSEFCYLGEECTKEHIYDIIEKVIHFDINMLEAISSVNLPVCPYEGVNTINLRCMDVWMYGKRLFYTDILYNTTGMIENYREFKEYYKNSKDTLSHYDYESKWSDYYDFALKIYDILHQKAGVILNIRRAYHDHDTEYLHSLVNDILPDLKRKYQELYSLHQNMWLKTYKPFGWEVLNSRYSVLVSRLEYAINRINEYLSFKIERLDELEFVFIENARIPSDGHKYSAMAYTSNVY